VDKIYITGALFEHATRFAELAEKAHQDGWLDTEVKHSLGAHLMCALALEGIINEVGETLLSKWMWERTEKIDTSLKWLVVSQFLEGDPFAPGEEPLQTVADMYKVRNRIVHPKSLSPGDETMVRTRDGRVMRDVSDDYVVIQDGDMPFFGLGKLLVEFNASSAQNAAIRTYSAFRLLKEKVPGNLLRWVSELKNQYPWLKAG
jgi:hypothetical protein